MRAILDTLMAVLPIATILTIFSSGVFFGVVLTLFMRRYRQKKQIELALDTIGITRKEFNRCQAEVDSVFTMVREIDERIVNLERNLFKNQRL